MRNRIISELVIWRSILPTTVFLSLVGGPNAPAQPKHALSTEPSLFDYNDSVGPLIIRGWVESQYSVFCGFTTNKPFGAYDYISIYKHIYWLSGNPHESWNFDVGTKYEDYTDAHVEILLDGKVAALYPEIITIKQHTASSSADICTDGIPGLCPDQIGNRILIAIVQKLDKANLLTFRISDGNNSEQHNFNLDNFAAVHRAINACAGNLLSHLQRR